MSPPKVKGARKVGRWLELLAEPGGQFGEELRGLYGDDAQVVAEKLGLIRRTVEAFAEAFGGEAEAVLVRSTGRVNLLGMHVDHRGGYVNPVAVGEVVFLAQARDDDRVVLRNVQSDSYPNRSFVIAEELPPAGIEDWDRWTQHRAQQRRAAGRSGDWADYVKSAVLYLQHLHTRPDGSFAPALRGMNVMVRGTVPVAAGLSSSSSIVVAAAEACRRINDLRLDDMELVDACAQAEWYVGTRGGGGDHAAIKFGRLDHVTHVGSFPLSVDWIPFPPDYRIVLADSLTKAEKSAGARDTFNQRVAGYVFALMLARKHFPRYAARLEQLRDLSPARLGVDEAEVYRVIRSLPERASRAEILAELADHTDRVEHVFGSHAAPAEGYRIRPVALYGVSECLRSEMAAAMLKAGDVAGFGELIDISHDGDRVTRLDGSRRVPNDNSCPDGAIDALIAALGSDDRARRERARLWRQPGGYNVSTEQLDTLVDIARASPGVVGAGLVGAGLGGAVVAVVERSHAPGLVDEFECQYYRREGLPPAASIMRPVGGAGVMLDE